MEFVQSAAGQESRTALQPTTERNKMNEAMQNMIEQLAAKLGTTTEHLWGVLCRQAPSSAVVGLACNAAIIWVVVLAWRKLSRIDFDGMDDNLGKGILYGCLALATAIALVCIFCELPVQIAGLLNPEYWALKQVLK